MRGHGMMMRLLFKLNRIIVKSYQAGPLGLHLLRLEASLEAPSAVS